MLAERIHTIIKNAFEKLELSAVIESYLVSFSMFLATAILSYILWFIVKTILIKSIKSFAIKSRNKWDDYLVQFRFFRSLCYLLPVWVIHKFMPFVFIDFPAYAAQQYKVTNVLLLIVLLLIIRSFLNALTAHLKDRPSLRDKPIDSYKQLTKLSVYTIFLIIIISVIIDKSPIYLLSGLGAMTAILILVFKDTILGFVASIQMSANDMVRIGDWITMPKYGADGDVDEINLTTVKVRNFDRTITTIPTYSFISDSFVNWRGMTESDGRRIKRSIFIKMDSVKFCTDEMITKFSKIQRIKSYLDEMKESLNNYNTSNHVDKSLAINGRNLTNIGVFRIYIQKYLEQNQFINHDMPFLIRQLDPTPQGVPLEIYAFSKDKNWKNYEIIVADIFDHIIASVKYFDLEIFENPSGTDFKKSTLS